MSDASQRSAPRHPPRWRAALVIVLIAAAVAAGLTWARYDDENLLVYRTAAGRLIDGQDMYEPVPGEAAFSYPPLMALPMMPLVGLPLWAQTFIWQFASALLLAVSLVLIRRCIDPMLPERFHRSWRLPWYTYLAFALIAGRHLLSPLENRSHDLIVLAVLMLCAYSFVRSSGAIAGAWAGIAAALKATPLLLLAIFAWQRRFWAVVMMLVALAAGSLLPDLIFPREDGKLWTVAWYERFVAGQQVGAPAEEMGAWQPWNHLNQNLAGTLYRFSRPPHETRWPDVSLWAPSERTLRSLTIAAQVGLLLFLAAATRPGLLGKLRAEERAALRVGQFSLALCAMLLLSPMSSKSHFCVLGLPVAFCLADFFARRRSLVTVLLLALVFVLGSLTVKDVIGRRLGNLALALGSVMWCTLALMLAVAWILRQRRRQFMHSNEPHTRQAPAAV